MSALHSFFWLSNIPLCGETSICLSMHPLIDIQVTSTFWLSGIEVLWTCVHKNLWTQFFWVILKSGMAGSHGNSVFNFLKNHHTMSHSSYTILRSPVGASFIPVFQRKKQTQWEVKRPKVMQHIYGWVRIWTQAVWFQDCSESLDHTPSQGSSLRLPGEILALTEERCPHTPSLESPPKVQTKFSSLPSSSAGTAGGQGAGMGFGTPSLHCRGVGDSY